MTPAEQVEAITEQALHLVHAATDPHPIEVDDAGWLHGDCVLAAVGSPNRQALAGEHIEGIVWHYTDTARCGAFNLQQRIAQGGGRAASWHLVIDREGKAAQSVDCHHGSWHAGGPSAALFVRGLDGKWTPSQSHSVRRWGANSWAFGIELENAGEVRLVNGEWLAWPFRRGEPGNEPVSVPANEVEATSAHGWHKFTDAQIATAERVAAALAKRYGLLRDNCGWTHAAIDPDRRVDPGPVFVKEHLPEILKAAFGV